MEIQKALHKATKDISIQDAEILLAFVLGKDKAYLYTHPETVVSSQELSSFYELVSRRSHHEPIAYLVGEKEFYGRMFTVTNDTLIPRPETELLVETIVNLYKDQVVTILDLGTGSGCIATTLAIELPNATILASDISQKALAVAKKNALKLQANVSFFQSDLLESITPHIDIIVANLPYLSQNDIDTSPTAKDLAYEPLQALLADDDGLHLIKQLVEQAQGPNKCTNLFLELLPRQIAPLSYWLENETDYTIKSLKDLQQETRFLHLQKK